MSTFELSKKICLLLALVIITAENISAIHPYGSEVSVREQEEEALKVIDGFAHGKVKVQVRLDLKKAGGCDRYSFHWTGKRLEVHASSTSAATRAFYDFIKSNHAGILSWSGSRLDMPKRITVTDKHVTSPYMHHQYLNVVTYGYSCAYWDERRWDEELDYMALHGIDMPLLMLAQEEVYRRVFCDEFGLSEEEIDEWETGPAHLPWMRMGNLSGNSFDGPLGKNWHKRSVEICRHVLGRMRRLGMKPVCPAFAGFVPRAFARKYNVKADLTGWDWVPDGYRNCRLSPDSEYFSRIGTSFIKKWEELFGPCRYYLSDSFNEMEIPQDKELMARYGQKIFKSMTDANPDAVWVMQGWTLSYQKRYWKDGILKSLVSSVPDDRFMLLYMATDYVNGLWEDYEGFYGKQWVWGVLPNMGGKTAYTGLIEEYANDRRKPFNAMNHGNLVGYGFSPEGIENNEMLYELIADAGWTQPSDSISVTDYLEGYSLDRYGCYPEVIRNYHDGLRRSVYMDFQDHPQYGWQVRNRLTKKGTVHQTADFDKAVEQIFTEQGIGQIRAASSHLLEIDVLEAAALYSAGKIEQMNLKLRRLLDEGKNKEARDLLDNIQDVMESLDALLEHHPLHKLSRWEDMAMRMASSPEERRRNVVNARRLLSVWYGDHENDDEPVIDYACRLFSGLIRDYYMPRLVSEWKREIDSVEFDQVEMENSFVRRAPLLSTPKVMDGDILSQASSLVGRIMSMNLQE